MPGTVLGAKEVAGGLLGLGRHYKAEVWAWGRGTQGWAGRRGGWKSRREETVL